MPQSIKILEEFFGSSLHQLDGGVHWLTRFDGFIHWHVLWDPAHDLLKIAADREARLTALPSMEIEGFYCSMSITPLTGGATALVLHPVGAQDPINYVVVTKAKDGRFSLSTTCGKSQQIAEPDLGANEPPLRSETNRSSPTSGSGR